MESEARADLIGYSDRWSAAAGDAIRFHVSATDDYRADLVRLRHGSEDPHGPGFRETVIPDQLGRAIQGCEQQARAGSCLLVEDPPDLDRLDACTIAIWFWPTLLQQLTQGLVSSRQARGQPGWALLLDHGQLSFEGVLGGETICVSAGRAVRERSWYFGCVTVDRAGGAITVLQSPMLPLADDPSAAVAVHQLPGEISLASDVPLLIGAAGREPDHAARTWGSGHFNGKLEDPVIFAESFERTIEALRAAKEPLALAPDTCVAAWDFSHRIDSEVVIDKGPDQRHGRLINLPARGMVGRHWSGDYLDPRLAPREWSAIHFHADDLGDAGWETAFEYEVPDELQSGIYAARLRSRDGLEDHVPFVVRPRLGDPRASVALLVPTLTYLAYANYRFDPAFSEIGITGHRVESSPPDEWLLAHPEAAASVYDCHSDGSGYCYSSRLRPIPNFRPRAVEWTTGLPRHLAADLYIVDWLEEKNITFDVITDEDLDAQGVDLLEPYRAVLTGSHPEYVTESELDALDQYTHAGGRLMYLGGNGFYWVAGLDRQRRSYVEIRRGFAAARDWESHPGEIHLSTNGKPGGLWRHRGRPPNALLGVGFGAQGFDKAPGYRRSPESYNREVSWIFEGVEGDVIGDFGLHMGGAAGDEIDRYDEGRGSPPGTVVLASSAASYSRVYQPALEDIDIITPDLGNQGHPFVRADLAYRELAGGGAVFAASAISWAGSLSHDGYSNSVSQVTENVLRRFVGETRVGERQYSGS